MTLRRQEFVHAAEALGVSPWRIMIRHLLPNSIGPVVVYATAMVTSVMVLESSLSFLGIGVRPPAASWGSMIGENLTTWQHSPHLLTAPAIVLAIAALAFNFVGDGLNDALNPQRALALRLVLRQTLLAQALCDAIRRRWEPRVTSPNVAESGYQSLSRAAPEDRETCKSDRSAS
jgi:hypothetical protein